MPNWLHVDTPLLHSTPLSRKIGSNVWLKLENLQPAGSFKIRGIGNLCSKALRLHGSDVKFVCSSGGNAGLAAAYAGRQLDVRVIIVVPKTTSEFMREKIEGEGAKVIVHGEVWDEADVYARSLVEKIPKAVYIPPFDHQDVWEGHASMIHEIKQQLDDPPAAIICVVGGGGLLNGVIMGLQDVGWPKVPVIAVETHGSNSFQASVVAGKLVTLNRISTIATSLGAKTVSAKSLELSLGHPVVPFAVSDAMAAEAVCSFADDHRFLVEAACGAGLSVCYTSVLRDILPNLQEHSNVVVIVCGGSNVSVDVVASYRKRYTNPPIIVRSGSEVFLKLGDGGTGSMDVNLGEIGVVGIGGEPEMGAEATMEAGTPGAGTEVEVVADVTAGETEAKTDTDESESGVGVVKVVEGEGGEKNRELRTESRTDVKMEERV